MLFLAGSCSGNKVSDKNFDDFKTINPDFELTSEAVVDGLLLPEYQCELKVDGVENSIPLSWNGVPEGTKSLAIVMYHYPHPENKDGVNSYILLWNIPPIINEIPYKMANDARWCMGANKDGNSISYTSPCSKGPGKHKYTIALFALNDDKLPSLPKVSSLEVNYKMFMNAIANSKIIDRTSLTFIAEKK